MKALIFFLLGLIIIMTSCDQQTKYASKHVLACNADYAVLDECKSPSPPPPGQEMYKPKLIKRGSITVSSTNIESTKSLIYNFIRKCKGHVVNESFVANDPNSYYQIVLNVQSDLFNKFFELIDSAKLVVIAKSFSAEDVTMQYIDNTTRLENKKKLEKRYLELLSKTKDIKDMLEIEEKLENIRSDIESRESQMKVMEKQIAYSEINLYIEKQVVNLTYDQKNKYSYKLLLGLGKGWQGIKAVVIFLISIWPLYIIALGVVYLVKFFRKKRR
jgi:hypothetical protein